MNRRDASVPSVHSRPAALVALAVLVALEAVGLLGFAVAGLFGGAVTVAGIALVVLVAAISALLVAVALGLLRGRPWTRAATFTWQVVQLLVGLYAFQPPGARPDLGTLTVAPAALALVLLFTRGVRAATARPDRSPPPAARR